MRSPLLVGAAAAAALVATYAAGVRTRPGQHLDDSTARAASPRRAVSRRVDRALRHYDEVAFACAATSLGIVGLLARGPVRTACGSAALVGTVAQVELLKATLPRPALSDRPLTRPTLNSFPSGHTAGIAALTAMGVVLAPGHTGRVAATGALATAAVGAATVVARWHRPSDVVGAALSAVQWGALGLAAAELLGAPVESGR